MATKDAINWQTNNLLGTFDSRWIIDGGGYINEAYQLILPAGAKASLTLTAEVNKEFKYLNVVVNFYSASLSKVNNFNSALSSIRIEEIYKDGADKIFKQRYRTLGLNTTNFNKDLLYYTDETILPMLDKKMAKFRVTVDNTKNHEQLTINTLSMFISKDVSDSQINEVTQNTLNKKSASAFKFYRNEDSSIKGVGIFIDSSADEIKLKPEYFQGMLVSIATNYGQKITVMNTYDDIILETAEEE